MSPPQLRRAGLLCLLLVLIVVTQEASAADNTNSDNQSPDIGINQSDGDEGESKDNNIPCYNAYYHPQMPMKRRKLTAREIKTNKLLNTLVQLRAELETPQGCNVSTIEIVTACIETASKPAPGDKADGDYDKHEFGMSNPCCS